MAMGRRRSERQVPLFVMADHLQTSVGHPFHKALNRMLAEADFDRWIEGRCLPYYDKEQLRGQKSIPPGVYFRMLLVGYFEEIDSQRGIAWRCADSLSLRGFLGLALDENSPDLSTLSLTRWRLPPEVFEEVFRFVLRIAADSTLLSGRTAGMDSTTLKSALGRQFFGRQIAPEILGEGRRRHRSSSLKVGNAGSLAGEPQIRSVAFPSVTI